MDKRIEEALAEPHIESQIELKKFVKQVQSQINEYERILYAKELVIPETSQKIKVWRSRLLQIIRENKELPEETYEDPEEKDGIEALKLLNRQLSLAESNQKSLEKSTLKLIGLDYTSNDIEKTILETRKKFESSVNMERSENRNLLIAFTLFITVCIAILIDKVRFKF